MTQSDPRKMGGVDYMIMAGCVCTAIYATAASLGIVQEGIVFCLMALTGTLFSFGVSRLDIKHPLLRYDGLMYVVIAISALFFTTRLNFWVPEDIFVGPVYVAGVMIWMMVLGSFFTWRDGTLLFQTVPSLALFSLVGCWDIYKAAALLFFIYLLGFATLMGRTHSRLMVRLAEASGYSQFNRLREGVWRWAAGPEWALGSAAAVVLISLLGAPVIQMTVAPIAGSVRNSISRPTPKTPDQPALAPAAVGDSVKVGQGPKALSSLEMLILTAKEPLYLRNMAYYGYNSREGGWRQLRKASNASARGIETLARNEIKDGIRDNYYLDLHVIADPIPLAGELLEFSVGREDISAPDDGSYSLTHQLNGLLGVTTLRGSTNSKPSEKAEWPLRLTREETTTERVAKFVNDAAKVGKTDYDKAEKVREAIANQVRYNLLAPPVPAGKDAVDFFLFESKEGYCDLFATSMTVAARQLGIPSRYVVGYLPDPQGTPNTQFPGYTDYIVRQKDLHAWAELYFKDHGWVVFDATLGAAEVPGGERGGLVSHDPFAWLRILGIVALIGAVVAGVPFGIRFARTRRTTKSLRQEAGKVYGQFEGILSQAVGHSRMLTETPAEFLAKAKPGLGAIYPAAEELNRKFEYALFAVPEPHPNELEELREGVKVVRIAARREKIRPPKQPAGKL